jgi:hypothetical protein
VISGPLALASQDGENSTSRQLTVSPIEFSIGPGATLKLPPNGGVNTLNLSAKFKNSYQLLCLKAEKLSQGKKPQSARTEKYTHLLIGKIKDTQIMFSFIIEAAVVEQTGPANGMS